MRERAVAAEAAYHAARAELMLSIQQADEQATSFREQLRLAEAAQIATGNELALSIQTANEQAVSFEDQMRVANQLAEANAVQAQTVQENLTAELAEVRAHVVAALDGAKFARIGRPRRGRHPT